MIKLTIMGITIVLFALTGCVDYTEVQSLQNAAVSLSNEVAQLKARITAVEEACLQMNTRLVNAESRGSAAEQGGTTFNRQVTSEQSTLSQLNLLAADTQTMEQITILSESKPSDRLTRSSFNRLVGMTVSEVLTMLGKPDVINEDGGTQSWGYRVVRLATAGGGVEASPALVVFDQGCVSRAILVKDTRDFPKSKGGKSGRATGQADQ